MRPWFKEVEGVSGARQSFLAITHFANKEVEIERDQVGTWHGGTSLYPALGRQWLKKVILSFIVSLRTTQMTPGVQKQGSGVDVPSRIVRALHCQQQCTPRSVQNVCLTAASSKIFFFHGFVHTR